MSENTKDADVVVFRIGGFSKQDVVLMHETINSAGWKAIERWMKKELEALAYASIDERCNSDEHLSIKAFAKAISFLSTQLPANIESQYNIVSAKTATQ